MTKKTVSSSRLLLPLVLSACLLQGCATAIVAGAAVSATSAADRRSVGSQIDDRTIELKSGKRIFHTEELRKNTHISVTSMNGQVLLTGQASNAYQRSLVTNIIQDIEGVVRVHNQIRIGTPTSVSTRTNDTWITSKIKTQLLTEDNVPGNSIKVVTENSEVFLLGIVTEEEANLATQIAQETGGVSKVTKVFEIIEK